MEFTAPLANVPLANVPSHFAPAPLVGPIRSSAPSKEETSELQAFSLQTQ